MLLFRGVSTLSFSFWRYMLFCMIDDSIRFGIRSETFVRVVPCWVI